MIKQELLISTTLQNPLEGFSIAKLDSKHRFSINSDWKEYFPALSDVILIYTGNYAVLIRKDVFDSHEVDANIIAHTTQIDPQNRLLLPINFLKAYSIHLRKQVYMIGKGNHIELYFHAKAFNTTKNLSLQAAVKLQVDLLIHNKKLL